MRARMRAYASVCVQSVFEIDFILLIKNKFNEYKSSASFNMVIIISI